MGHRAGEKEKEHLFADSCTVEMPYAILGNHLHIAHLEATENRALYAK